MCYFEERLLLIQSGTFILSICYFLLTHATKDVVRRRDGYGGLTSLTGASQIMPFCLICGNFMEKNNKGKGMGT